MLLDGTHHACLFEMIIDFSIRIMLVWLPCYAHLVTNPGFTHSQLCCPRDLAMGEMPARDVRPKRYCVPRMSPGKDKQGSSLEIRNFNDYLKEFSMIIVEIV